MGLNKEELNKVVAFVKAVKELPGNEEFITNLHKVVVDSTNDVPSTSTIIGVADEKIEHIYEYCIEDVLQRQAEEFYANFPVPELVPRLIEDFIRMERFRREDNFGDFSLSAYQQIEAIANHLCKNPKLHTIAEKMWGCSAYVKDGEDRHRPSISQPDNAEYTIAKLVFYGENKKTGLLNAVEKSKQSIQTLYASDKIRTVVYFVCYKAMMKSEDYNNFIDYTNILTNELYNCRNANHRGNTLTEYEKNILDRILPQKSLYYLKFMGILHKFISDIANGFPYIEKIEAYAKSIDKQIPTMPGPNIVGTIDLSKVSYKKNRFK